MHNASDAYTPTSYQPPLAMYIDTDLFVDFYGMPIPHASTGRFGDES